ncbi:hypothetical protein PTKIN_Ptkin14bG0192200 [Pterospermum kingtungense]
MAEGFIVSALTNTVGTLVADGVKYLPRLFGDRIGQSDPLPDLEFSKYNDQLVASKSYASAFDKIMVALKDDRVKTIGVWGMGGVGKTTLVTQLGYTAKSLQLFDKVIKVVVSQTPDIGKIQHKIADFLQLKLTKTTQEGKAEELWLQIEKEEKVLIVLDDMWSELNLKDIGVPLAETRKGCKIILTTRHHQVCDSMKTQVTVSLGVLEDDEAWDLFKMVTSLDNASPDINEVAKEIAKECGGLPIAIVTLARALRSTKDLNGWKLACIKLERSRLMEIENVLDHKEKNAYMCLELSYNHLRREATKKCFLMCGLYPEDYLISVEDLVRQAWGLRLYQNADSIQEVRSEVFEAIDNLKGCGLLLEGDEEGYVKVHDVVRDVARWIASKEDGGFLTKSGVESENENSSQKLEIRLLDNYGHKISIECFEGMQKLKVLSSRSANLWNRTIFSLNALKSLTNLRALKLEDFRELKGISAVAKLTKLEILSLLGAEFHESIEELGELKNLRLLDLRHCKFVLGFSPNLIQRLVKVEELYLYPSTIQMSDIRTVILPELNILSRLTSRSISLSLQVPYLDFSEDFVFPSLERYNIAINTDMHTTGAISSRSLNILGGLPFKVISQLLWNVELLGVSNIKNKDVKCLIDTRTSREVPVAAILQNLRVVRIENCVHLQVIFQPNKADNQKQLLSKLKILHLQSLQNLEFIWKMPSQHISLQSLEAVTIYGCDKLKSLFSFSLAQSLVRLGELKISGCHELKQIVEESGGNDKSPICLQNLRYLEISNCWTLEYVFPNFMALPLLEKLLMTSLWKLKQICDPARQREEHGIWLPQLQHLELKNCPEFNDAIHSKSKSANLELPGGSNVMSSPKIIKLDGLSWRQDIWKGPLQVVVTNLRKLEVYKCDDLTYIFSLMLVRNLLQLSTLKIWMCEKLEQIIVNDDDMSASSTQGHGDKDETGKKNGNKMLIFHRLKELYLSDMPNLKSFAPVDYHLIFPSLHSIKIENCSETITSSIVNSTLSRDAKKKLPGGSNVMSSLKTIKLVRLSRLQEIWKGPVQVVVTNLRVLEVYNCNNLTYIFSSMLVRNLLQLSTLKIRRCKKLEQIIVDDGDMSAAESQGYGEKNNKGMLIFPQLEELFLERLPCLTTCSPVGYHLVFPSLDFIMIEDCFQMVTSFTVDSTLSIHAKTKAPPLVEKEIDHTLRVNIAWHRRFYPTTLPPYIEESEEISPVR